MVPENHPQRRSFLGFLVFGLGAIFSAILGIPLACYVLDPRHRRGPASVLKLVDGVKLDDLRENQPVQGVLRDTRTDGWTLYPNDVLGRVWVVKSRKPLPADLKDLDKKTQAERDEFVLVFTTICPHLGCSVNLGTGGFACPCHAATFTWTGDRANPTNPAKRGMDTLEWTVDDQDPTRIKVKYQRFEALAEKKNPLA
jgi:Rieske Fe-S protein